MSKGCATLHGWECLPLVARHRRHEWAMPRWFGESHPPSPLDIRVDAVAGTLLPIVAPPSAAFSCCWCTPLLLLMYVRPSTMLSKQINQFYHSISPIVGSERVVLARTHARAHARDARTSLTHSLTLYALFFGGGLAISDCRVTRSSGSPLNISNTAACAKRQDDDTTRAGAEEAGRCIVPSYEE
jgi:hypothetical protein